MCMAISDREVQTTYMKYLCTVLATDTGENHVFKPKKYFQLGLSIFFLMLLRVGSVYGDSSDVGLAWKLFKTGWGKISNGELKRQVRCRIHHQPHQVNYYISQGRSVQCSRP